MNYSTFIQTTDGFYAFGYNELYQLGLGHGDNVNIPTKLEFEYEIYSIVPGIHHTFFITSDGLYCCGVNHEGQLGLECRDMIKVLTKVNFEHEIYSISAGDNHTFLITSDGIYGCGYNNCGQLGLGYNDPVFVCEFTKLHLDHEVYSIYCGKYHTMFTTSDGIYMCGSNIYGTLGLGTNNSVNIPTKIKLDHDIISSGKRFRSTKSSNF